MTETTTYSVNKTVHTVLAPSVADYALQLQHAHAAKLPHIGNIPSNFRSTLFAFWFSHAFSYKDTVTNIF